MKKLRLRKSWKVILLVAVAVLFFGNSLIADDLILVRNNGVVISGDFDRRSNENQLSLIKQTPQIVMRTSHAWNEFQSMMYRGKIVSQVELLKMVPTLQMENANRNQQAEAFRFWLSPDNFRPPAYPAIQLQAKQPFQSPRSSRVAAFNMNAHVANWDRDAELDGLIVHLYPVNSYGEIVPVDGKVELRLIGQRYRELDWLGRNNREKFPELEHWSKLVRKSDFGPDGAIIKLEFRRIRPEFRPELAQEALLTGSLGVAGQGRFDASATDVVIRPPSRFRDELYLRSRNRSRVHPRENYPRP